MSGIEGNIRGETHEMRAIEARPVAFPDLLPEIRLFYRALARRKGLEFAIEIDADVPPAIVTDRLRLQGLLHSLIANAFEFTLQGRIVLRIRRAGGCTPETTVIAFDVVASGVMRGRLGSAAELAQPATSTPLPLVRIAATLGGYLVWAEDSGGANVFSVYLPLVARTMRVEA